MTNESTALPPSPAPRAPQDVIADLETLAVACDEGARLFRAANPGTPSAMADQQQAWAATVRSAVAALQQAQATNARLAQEIEMQKVWSDDDPLFRVWDRERQCWAGDDRGPVLTPNTRDLEAYALDEFKGAKLVYCDMEGWSLADCGELYLHDECGNSVTADPARYEVRFNPRFLSKCGHDSAERWRARAEAAEAQLRAAPASIPSLQALVEQFIAPILAEMALRRGGRPLSRRHSCASCDLTDEERAEIDGWNKAIAVCEAKFNELAALVSASPQQERTK